MAVWYSPDGTLASTPAAYLTEINPLPALIVLPTGPVESDASVIAVVGVGQPNLQGEVEPVI